MSTLIYTVREDWLEQTAQIKHDRRRVAFAIFVVAVAIGPPGVFLADRWGTVARRAFLSEALSLCLYAAVAVWYGLRQMPRVALRVALTVYVVGVATMGLVDYVTKRNLRAALVDSPRADDPRLWFGALMLTFLPLLAWVAWRYPALMNRIGLNFFYSLFRRSRGNTGRLGSLTQRAGIEFTGKEFVHVPQPSKRSLGEYILVGLGVGLLIGLHFGLTARTAGIKLGLKPWPYMAWQFFYEVGPQSLTEELFMRGVVFNHLHFTRGWNFWAAALAASGLELLALLVKQDYSGDVLILVGAIFYTIVSSVASAGLFRWSRSILPGYVSNVVFSIVSSLR